MGYFYFDESIHPRGGFIVGAYVYTEAPLEPAVARVIAATGLRPGVDEFKSGRRVDGAFPHHELRGRLQGVLRGQDGSIGLLVAPSTDRDLLGADALIGLRKLIEKNDLGPRRHEVYFDEGVFSPPSSADALARQLDLSSGIALHPSVDSRLIGGIQVADMAAHTMATMLLEHMGVVNKKVKSGPNSGYDPDLEIEIGFELWASLRYNFFSCAFAESPTPMESPSPILDVASCGLHISDRCSAELRGLAEGRFGTVYLGCIH
jgi:hypothetical protein